MEGNLAGAAEARSLSPEVCYLLTAAAEAEAAVAWGAATKAAEDLETMALLAQMAAADWPMHRRL